MQHMLNDGVCDNACNNFACEYNDCNSQQISDKCLLDQDRAGIGFSEQPISSQAPWDPLVPVNLQLDLAPARLEIRMEINEMVLSEEPGYTQWAPLSPPSPHHRLFRS